MGVRIRGLQRTLGSEKEAHRLLGYVEGGDIRAILEVLKVDGHLAAVALLQGNGNGKLRKLPLIGRALHLSS